MEAIDPQQIPRILNEILVLATLVGGPLHGYQLALEIEERSGGAFGFSHGTLYPLLHQLESEGLIDGTWDAGSGRRRRKEYALTTAGGARLRERIEQWRGLDARISAFVVEGPEIRSGAAGHR